MVTSGAVVVLGDQEGFSQGDGPRSWRCLPRCGPGLRAKLEWEAGGVALGLAVQAEWAPNG